VFVTHALLVFMLQNFLSTGTLDQESPGCAYQPPASL
jgi:hypothetical protein